MRLVRIVLSFAQYSKKKKTTTNLLHSELSKILLYISHL